MNKPIFHITPERGWMNDPNGLVEYRGVYHVFYQADPEHLVNEKIGWGHKISHDLLHWEECPQALFPNECYDRDGCFTGSAVIKDDKMYLLYTGHVNQENGYIETQNLAVSEDGIHFEKYEGNPVIKNPPIDTTMRFRDPKIWELNGKYYVAIGGESKDKCGKVVYYVSNDLYSYTYCGKLADSDGTLGNMWECPNFTRIENTDILIFSPKGLGNGFPKSFESGYMLGTMDYENKKFEHSNEFANAFKTTAKLDQANGSEHTTDDNGNLMAEFNTNGKVGVLFNGVWNASGIDESLVDAIEPALFPGNISISSAGGGLTVANNMSEEKTALALEFVKYMTSSEVQEKIFTGVQANPCNTTVDLNALAEKSGDAATMKLAEACAQVNEADTIVIDMKYTWGSDVNKAIINALMECAVSGTDIDARFEALQKELLALIG